MMRTEIKIYANSIDEICLGINVSHDFIVDTEYLQIEIGFIFFSILITKYYNN